MSRPRFTEIKPEGAFSMFYFNNYVRDVKKELSHYLIDKICINTPRNITKFIYDMVWGILSFGSSKISMIGRYLYEKDIHVTENRLTKNLMELDLSVIKENYNRYAFDKLLKLNPNILIDETDIIKPFGKAFEGLSIIHDASKIGKPREKGWPATGIVSLTDDNYVVPLVINIYSSLSEDHKSIGDETKKHLNVIIPNVKKGYKSICSFDRGYDGSLYAEYVDGMKHFYVIRAKEKRIYTTPKGKMNIVKIGNLYKGKYSFTYTGKDNVSKFAKASAIKVKHKDFKNEFYVVIESIHNQSDQRAYITNIDCSTKEGVIKTLKAYRARWRIEEFFRFIKQEYELEKFMIRSLPAINNLFVCINIATTFLSSIIQMNPTLWTKVQQVFQPLTNYEKEEILIKKYGYHGINLYRAKLGIQMILGHTKGRPTIPGRDRRKKIEQLTLF